MKPLKPRDKVTQRMTRDGLTLDNQTTGESVNVSSREAEQEYTAEPGGAAEKVLERAGDIRDRHKAKQAAKDAGDVVTEAGEALHRPSSRLQFTAAEQAAPRLSKYVRKAEKQADKLVKQLKKNQKDYEYVTFESNIHGDLRKTDVEKIRKSFETGT